LREPSEPLFHDDRPFVVRKATGIEGGILIRSESAHAAGQDILRAVTEQRDGGVLPIDFSDVVVGAGAARQLLMPAIDATLDRSNDCFVVLENLDSDTRYDVDVMLKSEQRTLAIRDPENLLIGKVEPALLETYAALYAAKEGGIPAVEARVIQGTLGLNSLASATARLRRLIAARLARSTGEHTGPYQNRRFLYACVR